MMHRNSLRRALLVVLLVLLPTQFAWAAVSAYCQHEAGEATHLGHHEHEHEGVAGTKDEPPGKVGGAWDPDCGTCHAASLAFACPVGAELALTPVASGFALLVSSSMFSPAERPEKPKWLRLA